jgi:uncharacterized membrane protein
MPQRVESSVVVDAPVERVYDYWHTLENLPYFMSNIEEVRPVGEGKTRWKVRGPLGAKLEFEAQTTQDQPNESLAWNTTGGNVETSGQVRFKELGPESTRVEVVMNYWDPPAGQVGEVASRLVANPRVMLDQDLRNFKDIIEGRATPEEVQQRASAADVQSGAVAFLTSGTGLAVLGGALLLYLLLRRRRRSRNKKARIVFEF